MMDPTQIRLGTRMGDDPERNAKAGDPIFVSRDLLREAHVHVRGRTRSGKTSQAIAPLAKQLLQSYAASYTNELGQTCTEQVRDSLFVFDLGGDLALFNQVKAWAESNPPGGAKDKRRFRFISLARDDDWDYFDPFQSIKSEEISIIQIANMLVQAFHLDHGLVYGGSYYTQQNLAALLGVTRQLRDRLGDQATRKIKLHDVVRLLEQSARQRRDAEQIRLTFDFLLEYKQLQPPAESDRVIQMQRALEEGEVVYFFCPTMGESTTARQIAGLGLYTLINAAMQRQRTLSMEDRFRPQPHAWIFVDEFQELAGRSFAALLAQASKFGISMVMANQTTAQLQNRDLDLSHVVRDNTLLKLYFTVTGKQDIEELQAYCKEQIITLGSETMNDGFGSRLSVTKRDVVAPSLLQEDVVRISASPGECFLMLDDGLGHQDPIRLRPEYATAKEEYSYLKRTPLPRQEVASELAEEIRLTEAIPAWKASTNSSGSRHRQGLMKSLLKLKQKQELTEELVDEDGADPGGVEVDG